MKYESIDWSEQVRPTDHLLSNDGQSSNKETRSKCLSCRRWIDRSSNEACRPSFVVDDEQIEDQHAWSTIFGRQRKTPCLFCKRRINSADVQCLWCSQFSHRECLDQQQTDSICEYGRFRKILVRPQWLRRTPNGWKSLIPSSIDGSSVQPLVVMINRHSGGQQGINVYRKLVSILNPRQVFFIEDDRSINGVFDIYENLENVRFGVCGGDGTVGWILSIIASRFDKRRLPPVGIIPLGTGNDLSRVLGWGSSYQANRIESMIISMSNGEPTLFDRWTVELDQLDPSDFYDRFDRDRDRLSCCSIQPKFTNEEYFQSNSDYSNLPNRRFTNYLSFGLDGAVVLDFHTMRKRRPSLFTSPTMNKLIYLTLSQRYLKEFICFRSWHLYSSMNLICDQIDLTESIRNCHSIVLLNIPSYGSGTRPWQRSLLHCPSRADRNSFEAQSFEDGLIEVLGLDSLDMTLIHLGFSARRICQGKHVRLEFACPMPGHMDGEAFCLPKMSVIDVRCEEQVRLIRHIH